MSLYLPPHFQPESEEQVREALRRYAFSTLVTTTDGHEPAISHIPALYDEAEGRMRFHVARRSGHGQWLDGERPSLLIVHGPHAYVSSSWYHDVPSGSTWNYIAVHVHGTPQALDSAGQAQLVRDLTARLDPAVGEREIPAEYISGLLHAFAAFEMPIERVEAKFKMSQNRSERDRAATVEALRRRGMGQDSEVAEWVERFLQSGSA